MSDYSTRKNLLPKVVLKEPHPNLFLEVYNFVFHEGLHSKKTEVLYHNPI